MPYVKVEYIIYSLEMLDNTKRFFFFLNQWVTNRNV